MNLTSKALFAAALLGAYATAHAATEQFSYRFIDGELLNGTFTAQPTGADFTNISNVHAWFDGAAIAGGAALHVGSYLADGTVAPGGALLSPQVGLNNFFFADSASEAAVTVEIGFTTGGDGITVIAVSKPASGAITSDIFLNDLAGTSYSTGPNYFKTATGLKPEWKLSPVSAVPEPVPATMLTVGAAFLLLRTRRRK